jgi:hypothetical protein
MSAQIPRPRRGRGTGVAFNKMRSASAEPAARQAPRVHARSNAGVENGSNLIPRAQGAAAGHAFGSASR